MGHAIGASGGIFGVIGAFAVGVWRLRSPMYLALRKRLLFILALMVAADFTIGGLEPHVDNLAHAEIIPHQQGSGTGN